MVLPMLNIKDAIRLYSYLKDFIPDTEQYDKSFDFIRKIIHDIGQSDTPEAFGEALLLMYPTKEAEDLVQLPGTEIVEMFTQGLVDNKFLVLVKFCRLLGYD